MKLYIIRHGQSEDNVDSLQTGDRGLTANGRRQAHATARLLRQTHLDVLYTSPTRRTIETACIIAAERDQDPVVRSDICERGFLFDEPGLTGYEMQRLCPAIELGNQTKLNRGWAIEKHDESTVELYARAQETLISLRKDHLAGSAEIGLVTHAFFSGYLLAVAMGFTFEQVQKHWLRMNNCGVSCVEFREHATMLWYLNAHAHLDDFVTL